MVCNATNCTVTRVDILQETKWQRWSRRARLIYPQLIPKRITALLWVRFSNSSFLIDSQYLLYCFKLNWTEFLCLNCYWIIDYKCCYKGLSIRLPNYLYLIELSTVSGQVISICGRLWPLQLFSHSRTSFDSVWKKWIVVVWIRRVDIFWYLSVCFVLPNLAMW